MTIPYSFTPAVGYTGRYTVIVYGISNTSIPLAQTFYNGPFGSSISGTFTGVASDTQYILKIFTAECTTPVGQLTINP